jgi:hypothetical protein
LTAFGAVFWGGFGAIRRGRHVSGGRLAARIRA